MVNLEHKLTVDDLIVEYMMYKVKNGYEPSFLTTEFINFLYFFESKMLVEDSLYENEKLFQRFFERKAESDWSITIDWKTDKKKIIPHMDMVYSDKDNDYLIKANYKLSDFDRSVINTYFMDNGMGQYDDFKGQTFKIRNIIGKWLADYPKRKIDETIEIEEQNLLVGKYIAAEIITNIWNSYIDKQIQNHTWPRQCKDMNKYLLEMDLANIIGTKSIKKDLIELYSALSKRIAILYQKDKKLKIISFSNGYLAHANYKLLVQGYENIISIAFGKYNKSLEVDLSTLTFKESHEIDEVYNWDEDPDIKTTTTSVGNKNVKKLVKNLDNHNSNQNA